MNDDTQLIWEAYESSPRARFSEPTSSIADDSKSHQPAFKVLTVSHSQNECSVELCQIKQGKSLRHVAQQEIAAIRAEVDEEDAESDEDAEFFGEVLYGGTKVAVLSAGDENVVVILAPNSKWYPAFQEGDQPYKLDDPRADALFDSFERWIETL